MTTLTAAAPAIKAPKKEPPVSFTLLDHGRAISRSKKYLEEMWMRAVIPRLHKSEYLNPEITTPIFQDVFDHHDGVRKLMGADVRSWPLSIEALSHFADILPLILSSQTAFPSPWHLDQMLIKLKKGNPSPAIDEARAEITALYGDDLPKKPEALTKIPKFLISNRLGKSSFLSYLESNPQSAKIPETPDEAICSIYIGLLMEFYSKTLGNMQAASSKLVDLAATKSLEMRLTIEPHAFLSLGHHKKVDDAACFAADSSNGNFPLLLAAQSESVVFQIGYRQDSKFILLHRAWGRLHDNGIMLSNFYPKASHGSCIGMLAVWAASYPNSKGRPGLEALRPTAYCPFNTPKNDPCLWIPAGHKVSPLYHNGDALWWPLLPNTTKPPAIGGRVPASYDKLPWRIAFSFSPCTE